MTSRLSIFAICLLACLVAAFIVVLEDCFDPWSMALGVCSLYVVSELFELIVGLVTQPEDPGAGAAE